MTAPMDGRTDEQWPMCSKTSLAAGTAAERDAGDVGLHQLNALTASGAISSK